MNRDKMFKFVLVVSLLFIPWRPIGVAGQNEGDIITSFKVDYNPELSFTSRGIAFDGEYIYVLVCMADYNGLRLLKLNSEWGSVISTQSFPELLGSYGGLEWDGDHFWVSIRGDPEKDDGIRGLYKVDPNTGQILQRFPLLFLLHPSDLACDGTNMWVVDGGRPSWIYLVNVTDGSEIDFLQMPTPVNGLAFDGQFFWVSTGNRIFKINPMGSTMTSFTAGISKDCEALTFTEGSLWVLDERGLSIYYVHKIYTERGSDAPIEVVTEEPITITETEEIIITQEPITETVTETITEEQEPGFVPGFGGICVMLGLLGLLGIRKLRIK